MIPTKIQERLGTLRQRERFLQVIWGAARLAAVVLALVFVACLIDYLCDSFQETPWALRMVLFLGLLAGTVAAAIVFFWPLLHDLNDDDLALWVEEKMPRFGHRLITTVQLNREDASLEGMSRELVGVVTEETHQYSERISFAAAADHDRLKRSAMVVIPALALVAVPFLIWPSLCSVLLSRLFLADVAIARRVSLENLTQEVWPMGEKVTVKVRASGTHDGEPGRLVVRATGLGQGFEMERGERDARTGDVIFTAEVTKVTGDFTFNAYVGDGRLPKNGQVLFKPRPVVTPIVAWSQLPRYCDPRPGHGPYEEKHASGDASGLPGSYVRVQAMVQKKVKEITLTLYGPASGDPSHMPDTVFRKFPMTFKETQTSADAEMHAYECTFEINPKETVYEIKAVDEYGFDNYPYPRRTISLKQEPAPIVTLLREQFPALEDGTRLKLDDEGFDLDGLPVPVGGPLRIAYACSHPYGLGRAVLKYRVLKKRPPDKSNEKDETRWRELPLTPVKAGKGFFDSRTGVFEESSDKDQVPFHAVESPDPAKVLGRKYGGGRFDFHTARIVDKGNGLTGPPEEGDQIEYYIEVFPDLDPNASYGRPTGRSETRVKNVVSNAQLVNWLLDASNEESRIRTIGVQQGTIFPRKK